MARSFYSHIREAWRDPDEGQLAELQWQRKQEWREQGALERIDRPTRLDKARELGYKAKQGVVVVRASVRKGGARKRRHKAGRRTKRQGVNRIGRRKSIQRISEERASRKYPNLRVLNSCWVGEDGSQKWHEVILLDPNHPAIENDDDLKLDLRTQAQGPDLPRPDQRRDEGRGQRKRGKGTEHAAEHLGRPSTRQVTRRFLRFSHPTSRAAPGHALQQRRHHSTINPISR
ncbi:50S ribosomal protein L15e [Salinirarus marinus]|uniref:50S ribosomal protein L15e n=1 Tax=Salinirarus marinus TaxID=3068310 RepID=UPI003C6CA1A0